MKKHFAILASLCVFLSACAHHGGGDGMVEKAEATGYQELTDGVIGNGENAVLFFYAGWCGTCVKKDAMLSEWYSAEEFPVKAYRVDFDSEEGLRRKYNVSMQDTFVLIDGTGKMVKSAVKPDKAQLKRMLYLNLEEADAGEGEKEEMADEPEEAEEVAQAPVQEEVAEEEEEQVAEIAVEEEEEEEVAVEEIVFDDPEPEAEPEPAPVAEQAPTAVATSYSAYSDGVIGNGKESVLFFHAAWCPKCQSNDAKLSAWYEGNTFGRSIYKIDFDSATALRGKYGVTGQDTFILIDGAGNEISRARFPSEAALKEMLG